MENSLKVTVYCLLSGCTPEAVERVIHQRRLHGPFLTHALRDLSDSHEYFSQADLSVIGPMDASGKPVPCWEEDGPDSLLSDIDISPDTLADVRVLPHCTADNGWDFGSVQGPPPNDQDWIYPVSTGRFLMVQTHSLDIMALATDGRMTPLRLWRLAMLEEYDPVRTYLFKYVDYGDLEGDCGKIPELFPGLKGNLRELEALEDVELVKERLVHEGKYWTWMAPDRFPALSDAPSSLLSEVRLCESHGALERLPMDIFIYITSTLTLSSLVDLACTSRLLHTNIFGNDHLAYAWLCANAPWWIPAPTRTPGAMESMSISYTNIHILPYPASQPSPISEKWERGATGLDWAYVRRCARSGSMLNRRRIWKTVLDIERLADLAGV